MLQTHMIAGIMLQEQWERQFQSPEWHNRVAHAAVRRRRMPRYVAWFRRLKRLATREVRPNTADVAQFT